MTDPKAVNPKKTQEVAQTGHTHSGEDSLGDLPAAGGAKQHDLSFLRPAQGGDEIGRLGPYRVLKVLGEGGMGLVFQAHDPALDRILALKVMLPKQAQNQRAKQRFLVEARAVAKVEHEHIVPIYQVGEDNGVPFIAMPFLQGETLAHRIKRQPPLPWQEAARIAREMAEGLAAAHGKGLVHRDIKPANIWLDTPAPRKPARARILDFGLARNQNEDTHLTQQGAILGTPAYMSPEQAKAEDVDHRTDLFSLGSILYQMCTGKLPFPGANTFAIISALANTQPKPIRELNPQIPEGLAQIAVKLLEKDRNRRPKNAEHVAQAITMIEKNPAHNFMKKADEAPAAPAAPQKAENTFAFNEAITPRKPNAPQPSSPPPPPANTAILPGKPTPAPRPPKTRKRGGIPTWIYFAGGGAVIAVLLVVVLVLLLRTPSTPVVQGDPADPKDRIAVAPPIRPVPAEQKPQPAGKMLTNSVGMTLVGISPGKFMMGSPPEEKFRGPQEKLHEVQLTRGFYIGKHEVTRGQFRKFIAENPGYKTDAERTGRGFGHVEEGKPLALRPNTSWLDPGFPQGDDHPAVCVSWHDAKAFCEWLSAKEKKVYDLPTEAEWEYCCRAGTTTTFYWGENERDFTKHEFLLTRVSNKTSPTGRLVPNPWGLYDMAGNVREWVEDGENPQFYENSPLKDPLAPQINSGHALRGGAFTTAAAMCGRSAFRWGRDAKTAMADLGFRVVLREQPLDRPGPVALLPERKPENPPEVKPVGPPPVPPVAPPPGKFFTNALGMKFVGISPGKFMMGSPPEEKSRDPLEMQHEVQLTKGFFMGQHEVTRGQFRQFVDDTAYKTYAEMYGSAAFKDGASRKKELTWLTPDIPQDDEHPVVCVSWKDATAFCDWLGGKDGKRYSLPTEAEWEYCCRAGSITPFHWGERDVDGVNFEVYGSGKSGTKKIGSMRPNAWELYDMGGNVREWVADGWDPGFYQKSPLKDPVAQTPSGRGIRGGAFTAGFMDSRSALRRGRPAEYPLSDLGFRVVLREEPAPGALMPPEVKPMPPDGKAALVDRPLDYPAAKRLQDEWGAQLKTPVELSNKIGMKLMLIPPGGKVANPFYLGKFEVLQAEWNNMVPFHPSYFHSKGKGKDKLKEADTSRFPVENMTWFDCVDFCNRLSQIEGFPLHYQIDVTKKEPNGSILEAMVTPLGGIGYRLPTQSEWDHACGAGANGKYFHVDRDADLDANAWNLMNSGGTTHPVGKKNFNPFRLLDMLGNVSEWLEDEDVLADSGTRVRRIRGGSWLSPTNACAAEFSLESFPGGKSNGTGFRVARSLPKANSE